MINTYDDVDILIKVKNKHIIWEPIVLSMALVQFPHPPPLVFCLYSTVFARKYSSLSNLNLTHHQQSTYGSSFYLWFRRPSV